MFKAHEVKVLDPIERISEVLFGLIMVLTFTGTLSVTAVDREEVRTVLIGAIGCNLAWGIVDAMMYLLTNLIEKGRKIRLLRAMRKSADPEVGRKLIAAKLPDGLDEVFTPADLETMRVRLDQLPLPPAVKLTRKDFRGAFGVFLLVFLSTFPVVIPFIIFSQYQLALRASNGVAIVMLFGTGYILGRYAGYHPWRLGLAMVLVGLILVSLTIALGG